MMIVLFKNINNEFLRLVEIVFLIKGDLFRVWMIIGIKWNYWEGFGR